MFKEILNYIFGVDKSFNDDYLMHYGVGKLDGAPGRGSGRYPLGSGENPNQHGSGDIISRVDDLRKQNIIFVDEEGKFGPKGKEYRGDTAVAHHLGMTTTQMRARLSLAKDEERSQKVAAAKSLREQGYSLKEIANRMGYENDSSVRSLLNEGSENRMNQAKVTADFLKQMCDEKGIIDVGAGVERERVMGGISREKLEQALYLLQDQGYEVYGGGIPQVTNKGQQTNGKFLCPPGTPHKAIYDFENIHSVADYDQRLTDDGQNERGVWERPSSVSSSRVQVRYAEDGGIHKDGVIEIRRGCPDISLGNAHYAQVRIMVDGTHYIKGMALYSDDLPEGCDIMFNTNKKKGTPMCGPKGDTVLKPVSKDPDNPFGALLRKDCGQTYYDDPNGKYIDKTTGKKQSLNTVNITRMEGDWSEWSDKLPSQFLGKQKIELIKRQLKLAETDKQAEYDDIMALTNPTVKRRLLRSFADDCDSAAVHLKAAALPRQKYKVILPLTTISDQEVYAPSYKDGEQVALIRYPHAGTFEIPILTVNNKHPEGRRVLGNTPKDAIGINSKVAERLSGADFDGDTVMIIPTGGKVKITSTKPLEGLKDFDPKMSYGADRITTDSDGNEHLFRGDREYKRMRNTQNEMGKVSNLITDMTIRGAKSEELARAVRHSMVVIDAEKHGLDYKQSERDNRIGELKAKYQGHIGDDGKYHEGVSTLLSASKGEATVIKRQGSPKINQEGKPWYDPTRPEGVLVYKNVDNPTYIDKKTGKEKTRTQKSTRMAETDDARTLSSGSPQEEVYADYANKMKALANRARMEMISTERLKRNPSAAEVYKPEVDSLKNKLNIALLNAPRERQAQIIANSKIEAIRKSYEETGDYTKKEIEKELKKERQKEMEKARIKVGAHRQPVEITEKEWEAIQAGAISDNMLSQILNHADIDKIKALATPRSTNELSQVKINKIAQMRASDYTLEEIASSIGVSTSTVEKYL